jgi:hypothetical protein
VSDRREKGYWYGANSDKLGLTGPDIAVIKKGWSAARDWFKQEATIPESDGESFGVGGATGNKHCIAGDSPGVIITPGEGLIRFAFGVSFPTNDGNANADSRSMQLLIHALHGVRCIIVDLVLMQFNGGTEFMGSLSGPDMTYGEVLSQSLDLRADALQLIASKCIFFACGEAAKRFKQYGVQYTISHPQCAWGGSGPLNDWRALCEYEELIMFATGGGIDDEMAASERLNNARKHALSRAQAEASTACRSVEDEMQVILLFRLHYGRGRLKDVEKSLRKAGKQEEANELKKEADEKKKKEADEKKKKKADEKKEKKKKADEKKEKKADEKKEKKEEAAAARQLKMEARAHDDSYCQHGRQKHRCKDCGTGHCQHGREKNRCKDCGTGLCQHGRPKNRCKDCGTGYCQHGKLKRPLGNQYRCKECGG